MSAGSLWNSTRNAWILLLYWIRVFAYILIIKSNAHRLYCSFFKFYQGIKEEGPLLVSCLRFREFIGKIHRFSLYDKDSTTTAAAAANTTNSDNNIFR